MSRSVVVAAVLALGLSGCSLTFQSRPAPATSSASKTAASSCSTARAWWIADAVGVAAGVAAMTLSIVNRGDGDANIYGGIGALGSVFYTASMGNGIRWRRECIRASESAPSVASVR